MKPPEMIGGPGYVIYITSENTYFVAARTAQLKEALAKACNQTQFICQNATVGVLVEGEKVRK